MIRTNPLPALVCLAVVAAASAADAPKAEPRVAVARSISSTGWLLQLLPGARAWQVVKQGAELFSADTLVGLPGAGLDSKNGKIRLELLSDLAGDSPYPVLESAVVLHAGPADLNFTLDRGRVKLSAPKEKGTARVGFRNQTWELALEPRTEVGLELYGRWAPGVFLDMRQGKATAEPVAQLVLTVLRGAVEVKHSKGQIALQAPPGPARFGWDSAAGADAGAQRLDKAPEWAEPPAKPDAAEKLKLERIDRFGKALAAGKTAAVIGDLLRSKDADDRRLGVIALGATDDLPQLIDALNDEKQPDVRLNAVQVLRHWIGRGPGQDQKLYDYLVTEKKYPPGQADIALRLLHSFGRADLGRPETWELLIAYLTHDKQPVRELARWHLYRLVAAARDIPYDAAAPAKQREAAQEKWRVLIPEGKLPPRVEDKPKP